MVGVALAIMILLGLLAPDPSPLSGTGEACAYDRRAQRRLVATPPT
jgi:hypothetical protein